MITGRRITAVLGGLALLGALGFLVKGNIGEGLVYYLTPAEVLAKGVDAEGQAIRLGGLVQPGSVVWKAEELDLRFVVADETGTIPVIAKSAPPQMFREGMGVVVEGRMVDGVFHSSSVIVKHSNEYQPPADGHTAPAEAYKTLMKNGQD
ncbi:MAG: cytochrome c maturation protein CcmE [Gemmatimonadota bacterium]